MAASTATRATQAEAQANLLPVEFATRYQQQFVDRLWMGGLGAVVGLYIIGVAIYFVALEVALIRTGHVEDTVAEAPQNVANVAAADRIDAVGGLVQNQNGGRMNERLSEAQALQHAFGVFADAHRGPLTQAHQLQLFGDQLLSARCVDARECRVKIEHAGAGEVSGKTVILRQVPDGMACAGIARVPAEYEGGAVRRPDGGEQRFDEGGLPCPVRTQEPENGATADPQRNAVNGPHLAPLPLGGVHFGQVLSFDGEFGVHSP